VPAAPATTRASVSAAALWPAAAASTSGVKAPIVVVSGTGAANRPAASSTAVISTADSPRPPIDSGMAMPSTSSATSAFQISRQRAGSSTACRTAIIEAWRPSVAVTVSAKASCSSVYENGMLPLRLGGSMSRQLDQSLEFIL
jgi:hypothetical protein